MAYNHELTGYEQVPGFDADKARAGLGSEAVAEMIDVRGRDEPDMQRTTLRIELGKDVSMTERIALIGADAERRIADPAFDGLAAVYGEDFSDEGPYGHLVTRIERLRAFTGRHLDFRKKRSRQDTDFAEMTEEDAVDYSAPEVKMAFNEAADAFEMLETTHATKSFYDGLKVPSGAGSVPLLRAMHALEQKGPDGEPVQFGWIGFVGSDRRVNDAERARALHPETGWAGLLGDRMNDEQKAALNERIGHAQTEYDLTVLAAETLLDVEPLRTTTLMRTGYEVAEGGDAEVKYYRRETEDGRETPVFVLKVPAAVGEKQANTGRTYSLFRAAAGRRLAPGADILVASTSYVAPFQHVKAVEEYGLQTGAGVETIGYGKEYATTGQHGASVGETFKPRTPQELGQEIKSYVDKLWQLQTALAEQGKQ